MFVVTAEEMRELDRLTIESYGTPSHVLMERAGAATVEALLGTFPHARKNPIIVVAGKGNNGGDGFVVARLLKKKGIGCEVILVAKKEQVKGDALRNLNAFTRLRGRVTEITEPAHLDVVQDKLNRCGLIVDALLGTGLNVPVRGLMAAVIDLINASGVPIVAVDVPSGLDANSGQILGTAVQAELTVTFAFPKLGQIAYPGATMVGQLAVADIGIASEAVATVRPQTTLLMTDSVGALIRPRHAEAHKGDFGHLLIVAGARGKSGAALLCSGAALRTGTGLVTLAGPIGLNVIFCSALLEAMTIPLPERSDGSLKFDDVTLSEALKGKTAIAFGPGVGVSDDTVSLVRWLLEHSDIPLVIDADGLNCIAIDPAMLRRAKVPVVLTPHPGEMARLMGSDNADVQARRLEVARTFVAQYGCYLVLKGARTLIAAPNGRVWINPTGNPGMASGGMGDVLTGILGGLLAQGYPPEEASTLGVFLHGYAADLAAEEKGQAGLLARDVIERLPNGLRALSHATIN